MYTRKTYVLHSGKWIEREYHYKGRYGAKGEQRAPKRKVTPEQIMRQNQWIRERYIRRLIMDNFRAGDLWATIKFPAGSRPPLAEVTRLFERFRNNLRNAYRKEGQELKYIYRIEVGARGGIHIHMLVNRLWNSKQQTDRLLEKKWSDQLKKYMGKDTPTGGMVDYKSAYEEGGFQSLAEYLCKRPTKESQCEGQMNLFGEEEQKKLLMVQISRNLSHAEPQVKPYTHWTMRKILDKGPVPTPGYYIIPDSIIRGVNPVTGMSYLYYTEERLPEDRGRPKGGGDP